MQRLRQLIALAPLVTSGSTQSIAAAPAVVDVTARLLVACQAQQTAPFAASFAAGSARAFATEPREPGSIGESAVDERQASSLSASTSQPVEQEQSSGDWTENFSKLLEDGDVAGQAELLKNVFGESPEPYGPPLQQLLSYNRREEEKAQRRLLELQKQEEIRQSMYDTTILCGNQAFHVRSISFCSNFIWQQQCYKHIAGCQ